MLGASIYEHLYCPESDSDIMFLIILTNVKVAFEIYEHPYCPESDSDIMFLFILTNVKVAFDKSVCLIP